MPNQLVFGLGDERYKVVNKVKLTTKRLFNASDTQENLIEMRQYQKKNVGFWLKEIYYGGTYEQELLIKSTIFEVVYS